MVVLGPAGPSSGLKAVISKITTTNKNASKRPGRIPAMNNLPMLSSVRIA